MNLADGSSTMVSTGNRPDDLRLLPPRRHDDPLRFDPWGRRRRVPRCRTTRTDMSGRSIRRTISIPPATEGSGMKPLAAAPGYDAEATVSPTGRQDRVHVDARRGSGSVLDEDLDGSNVRRLTNELGYDGGAFYSWDGKTHRVSRVAPDGQRVGGRRIAALLGTESREAVPDGALRHERRWLGQASDHEQRCRQFRPVLPPGQQAHHLRVERLRSPWKEL